MTTADRARRLVEGGLQGASAAIVDGEVDLSVRDSGLGIARERQKQIFDDYVTANPGAVDVDSSLGLGLAVVRRGAALLGHTLNLHSVLGVGSCFSLRLGLIQRAPEVAVTQQAAAAARGVVALVENDPIILESLTDVLNEWGCEVVSGTSATHVKQRLDAMRLEPQMIVSDLHLGTEADGFDAVRLLRGSKGHAIPAIVLTGDLKPAHRESANNQNVRLEYKPLRPSQLQEMIATMMVEARPG